MAIICSNGHHQVWLGSATANRHSVAVFDLATLSGCDQLVVGPTHTRMVDHLTSCSMALAIPNLCFCMKVFLKHQVNWNTVGGARQDLPSCNIRSADNHVEVLNEHFFLLVGRFIST